MTEAEFRFLDLFGLLGGPEIIVIFVVLILLAVPVALCLGLVYYFTRKDRQARVAPKSSPPPVEPLGQGADQG